MAKYNPVISSSCIVVCIAVSMFAQTISAGSCWMTVENGRCQMPLSIPMFMGLPSSQDALATGGGGTIEDSFQGISREECCAVGGHSTAWTPHTNVSKSQMFYWIYLAGGAPDCKPCRDSCVGVECEEGKVCRKRQGVPQCVCAPDCSASRAQYGNEPVCGTDLRTYRNHCHMLRSNCRRNMYVDVNYPGRCKYSCDNVQCLKEDSHCVLDQNALPHCVPCSHSQCEDESEAKWQICGADGITYPSMCHFRHATCLHGRSIGIAYKGACMGDNVTCDEVAGLCRWGQQCLMDLATGRPRCVTCDHCNERTSGTKPLCATDGRTYGGWCAIVERACNTGVVIETQHFGACGRSRRKGLLNKKIGSSRN